MEFLSRLLLFAVACGGLTVLLVGIVNRTHAYGWNRKLVDVLMLACAAGLLVGWWPLAQFASGDGYPSSWPHLPRGVVQATGWGSIAIAGLALVHSAWRWFHPERRGGATAPRTSPIDMQLSPEEMLAEGWPRWIGTLPANEVLEPQLVELDLLVPDLPSAFDGMTIAHLSDLHMSGRILRNYFDRLVEVTNSLRPEMVVVTGDIVERVECLDWIDQSLARLEAQEVRLFVLGNHDVKSDPVETRRRLVAAGFLDLGSRVDTLHLSRGPCVVAGNERPWFGTADDLASIPPPSEVPNALRLALLHTPDHFAWTQRHGFHVALAGHNHGGQIRFPVLGALLAPSIYGTRYASGVFRAGGTVMHVSPGTASLTPARWNCPPELNLLTLSTAPVNGATGGA